MIIKIKQNFENDFTTRIDGEKLRNIILETTGNIEIDFIDVKVASASFFDEAIAKLIDYGFDSHKVKEKIKFKNLYEMDKLLLKQVCKQRGIEVDFA